MFIKLQFQLQLFLAEYVCVSINVYMLFVSAAP